MKIVFMGTPDFAIPSLDSLVKNGHNIIAVITQPDRPSGRGMKLTKSAIKEYAESKDFEIYQPEKIRKDDTLKNILRELQPDLMCVVAYGQILPKDILDIPKLGCINVHGSLLPKYRGAAPIQWAIINGEKITGITTMYMDVGMDTGDIILKREFEIGENKTSGELFEILSVVGGEVLSQTVDLIEKGIAPREKQPEEYTMAPMISKETAKIDWQNKNANEIKNLVRGLNPIMGAYTTLSNNVYKFWKIDVLESLEDAQNGFESRCNGEVVFSDVRKGLFIKSKNKLISVLEIQGPNSRKMSIGEFLRGNRIEIGNKFE